MGCEPQRSTLVMNVSVNYHVNTADEKFDFVILLKPKALFPTTVRDPRQNLVIVFRTRGLSSCHVSVETRSIFRISKYGIILNTILNTVFSSILGQILSIFPTMSRPLGRPVAV